MEVKTILSSRKPKASLKGNETLNITIIAQTQQLDTRLPVLPLATFDGDPYSWKPYVANRTTKILKHIESCRWFYIESGMNPADYASKGLTPSEILDANLWWNGPDLNQLPPQVELVLDEEQTALIEKEMKKDTSVFFQSLSNPEIILTKAQIIINSYEKYIFIS
uniref:Uncharacterized protein n=1 Tax=Megaselia scalaris TaxID=36166 RepID=T1GKQ0_MEGSC